MSELEPMLRVAAAEVAWPPTPDLAGAAFARIGAATSPPVGRRRPRLGIRRPVAIALAVLLAGCATAAALPGIRNPVLDWLGLRSVRVERVPRPLPEAAGRSLALGEHTTLAQARQRLGFTPVLASGLGTPVVYFDRVAPGGQLGLVYRRGGLLITEVIGDIRTPYLEKFVQPATKVERLRIGGARALWISGLHQYAYLDASGTIRPDAVRTAGSVLLVRRGKLLVRLEGARSRAEALRIATSLRAAP